MEIPVEIVAAIEADVVRYREMRLNAARKKLTPENIDKLQRKRERDYIAHNDLDLINRFVGGESPAKIAASFKFVSEAMVKNAIREWYWNSLNPNWDDPYNDTPYVSVPRYHQERWRSSIFQIREADKV
jgi:hypothetical protein